MYTLFAYGRMVADDVRMDAYLEAMQRAIKPGSIVVDLGAGPGVMALHACRLGAARVYAIEPDDSIAIAVELAAANGMAGRIALAQQFAERLDLPERVDVIVSDLRGAVPLHGSHLAVIASVRERWLRPGGTLIPGRDQIQAGLVRPGPHYEGVVAPWQQRRGGLDLTPALKWVLGSPKKVRLAADDLATAPQTWAVLDYREARPGEVTGALNWTIAEPVTACGAVLWTEADLLDGIGFSNAPGPRAAIHGQLLLPWSKPVALAAGEEVRFTATAAPTPRGYLWKWTTEIVAAGGAIRETFTQGGAGSVPSGLRRFAGAASPPA